jgi:hypothetical protein
VAESSSQHGQDLDRLEVDGCVIDDYAALVHHLFDVPQALRITHIPARSGQLDLERVMQLTEYCA